MTKALALAAVALALLAAVPATTAHGAPPVRPVDTRLLLDDDGVLGYGGCAQGTCQPAVPTGLDVLALDVREAFLDDGSPAAVFRIIVQSAAPPAGSSLVLHLTAGGKARDLTATTTDGLAYTSPDFDRLDGPFDVGDGHPKALDGWLRYTTLGAKPGDQVTAISVDSLHGTSADDTMPGGWSEQGAMVPSIPSDPSKAADMPTPASYTLRGPAALVAVSVAPPSVDLARGPATVQVTLRNNTTLPQFASLTLASPIGTAARLAQGGVSLEPSATRTLDLRVTNATADGALRLTVVSDLGARSVLEIPVKAAPPPPPPTGASSSSSSGPAKSSPAPVGALVALALLAMAATRRRM